MTHYILGSRQDRFNYYRTLKAQLLVFPELAIAKQFDADAFVWSSQLSVSQKRTFWLDIMAGRARCPVLATRHGLFLPFNKIERLIVDEPSHPGHREGQSPKYLSKAVAGWLAEKFGAELFLGSPILGVEGAHALLTDKAKAKELVRSKLPKIIIAQKSIFEFEPSGRTLYFLPKKGDYAGFCCRSCETVQPLPPPIKCAACGGTRFRPYGIGTTAAANRLEKLHGKKTAVVDQKHPVNQLSIVNCQLIVATHKIFDYDLTFDNVVAAFFDELLHLADPLIAERVYETLTRLAQMARRLLVVDTRLPNHPSVKFLGQPNLFYRSELSQRRANNLPPYRRLIKLTGSAEQDFAGLPQKWRASPVHLNTAGLYQVIVRLPPKQAIKAPDFNLGKLKLEPDPAALL